MPSRSLKSLDPYDHLRRFLRLCVTHFNRNIHDLPSTVSYEVKQAMRSLSSSEPHPDLEGAFATIQAGGPKAKAWLKDKRYGSKFALPALYQPHSLIPLNIWKASPSTSNGNEQAHRNINRDGINLTILGGIMLGMQFDARAATSLELYRTQGIYTRDQEATHFRRYERSINRQLIAQRRTARRFPSPEMNEDFGADSEAADTTLPMTEYVEPNSTTHFSNLNMNNPTQYTSQASDVQHEPSDVATSESFYCPCPACTVPGCTGFQHFKSYSGLDRALTMNAQPEPNSSESESPPVITSSSSPAHNGTFGLLDANSLAYRDHNFTQLYNLNTNSSLWSVSVETHSSSLDRALG